MEIHRVENNKESQQHFDKNKEKFRGKCLELLERLLTGERLTVLHAANTGISSLPRRIKDLKDILKPYGITIKDDEWITVGKSEVKIYYLTWEMIERIKREFKIS